MLIDIRAAELKDRDRIIEISSKIWGGHDYIPEVVDYWLAGNNGILWVAEQEGVVKGYSRMTYLRPNTSWMEGIRVDTEARGLGIGKALTAFQIQKSFEEGFEHCELSSYIENYESLSIVEKYGFKRVAAFKIFEWNRTDIEAVKLAQIETEISHRLEHVEVTPVTMGEVAEVFARIEESHMYRRREGYFSFDWTFEHLDQELLRLLIQRGELFWIKVENEEKGLFSLSRRFAKGEYKTLNYVCRHSLVPFAAAYAVSEALKNDEKSTGFMAVDQSLNKALLELGYTTFNDQNQDVFVYRLNK